jgi:hypothetical protein
LVWLLNHWTLIRNNEEDDELMDHHILLVLIDFLYYVGDVMQY